MSEQPSNCEDPQADSGIRQVVIFDGHCAMCDGLVRFSLKHLKEPDTGFVASQSPLGQRILEQLGKPASPSTLYVLRPGGIVLDRSDAVLELLQAYRTPFSWMGGLKVFPKSGRDGLYRIIARVRRWIPLKQAACEVDGVHQNLLLDQHEFNCPEWLKHA